MNEKLTKAKDFILRYWFVFTSLIVAVLYYVMQRQGYTIADLKLQIEQARLGEKLKSILEKEAKDEAEFQKNRDAYLALKRRHPEYFSDS